MHSEYSSARKLAGTIDVPLYRLLSNASFSMDPSTEPLGDVVSIFHTALKISRWLGGCLPTEDALASSFWEDYHRTFAQTVVGPLIGNRRIIIGACENLRSPSIEVDEPLSLAANVIGHPSLTEQVAAAQCGRIRHSPGKLLAHSLRGAGCASINSLLGVVRYKQAVADIRAFPALPEDPGSDILWLSIGSVSVEHLALILPHLKDTHKLSSHVLDMREARSTEGLKQHGIPASHWGAALHDAPLLTEWQAQAHALSVARAIEPPDASVLEEAGLAKADVMILKRAMTAAVRRFLPMYHLWHAAAKETLDRVRPRCLAAFNNFPRLAPLIRMAHERGIPSVYVQHGSIGQLYFKSEPVLPYDHLLVFGQYSKEVVQPQLAPHAQVWFTGSCLCDVPPASEAPATTEPGREQKRVLITPQWYWKAAETRQEHAWIRCCCEVALGLGAEVWIKPHPNDPKPQAWDALAASVPGVKIIPHGTRPLDELIIDSDVLVTRFSSAAFNALILGRPVLAVDTSGEREHYPFGDEGAALKVTRCEDIAPSLQAIFSQDPSQQAEQRRQFLLRHLGQMDGRASARIADIVATLARQPDDLQALRERLG